MVRPFFLSLLAGLVSTGVATAQTSAPRFRWQADQVLTYKVEQITSASEEVGDTKVATKTNLNLMKRWQVKDVDAAGVATLEMSLTLLRLENTRPNGEVLLFDSANPEKSTPEMKKELAGFVGQTLAVLRVDGQGKVVEVKESKFGPASRFESELPFVLTLPEAGIKEGQAWERAYTITLDPPDGTGEKYAAAQKYACKSASALTATITMTSVVKDLPANLLEQIPLLQLQPQGEIVFDTKKGVLQSARLAITQELKGHQGEGSSYRLQSAFTEELVANP